jgi:hypothetical protein
MEARPGTPEKPAGNGLVIIEKKGVIAAFEEPPAMAPEDAPAANALAQVSEAGKATAKVESAEFKILLDGSRFTNEEKAVKSLWKLVKRAAEDAGVKLKETMTGGGFWILGG